MLQQAGARQQMGAPVVHQAQIAGVVQVQIEVDVIGPDAHAQRVFLQNAQRRQRPDELANGQRRNANKTDVVRQDLAPVFSATSVVGQA